MKVCQLINVCTIVGAIVCVFYHSAFAQDDLVSEIAVLYTEIQNQLIALKGSMGQFQSDVSFYMSEVERLGQNQQETTTFDAAMIMQIREKQDKRGQDLTTLLSSRDLWQRNFAVVNKTFTNIKKKVPV